MHPARACSQPFARHDLKPMRRNEFATCSRLKQQPVADALPDATGNCCHQEWGVAHTTVAQTIQGVARLRSRTPRSSLTGCYYLGDGVRRWHGMAACRRGGFRSSPTSPAHYHAAGDCGGGGIPVLVPAIYPLNYFARYQSQDGEGAWAHCAADPTRSDRRVDRVSLVDRAPMGRLCIAELTGCRDRKKISRAPH